jgi:hypothetical protein
MRCIFGCMCRFLYAVPKLWPPVCDTHQCLYHKCPGFSSPSHLAVIAVVANRYHLAVIAVVPIPYVPIRYRHIRCLCLRCCVVQHFWHRTLSSLSVSVCGHVTIMYEPCPWLNCRHVRLETAAADLISYELGSLSSRVFLVAVASV